MSVPLADRETHSDRAHAPVRRAERLAQLRAAGRHVAPGAGSSSSAGDSFAPADGVKQRLCTIRPTAASSTPEIIRRLIVGPALHIMSRWSSIRYLALSVLVVWLGGMIVLGLLVAPSTFGVLQTAAADAANGRMLAGAVFGEILRRFHYLALWLRRDSARVPARDEVHRTAAGGVHPPHLDRGAHAHARPLLGNSRVARDRVDPGASLRADQLAAGGRRAPRPLRPPPLAVHDADDRQHGIGTGPAVLVCSRELGARGPSHGSHHHPDPRRRNRPGSHRGRVRRSFARPAWRSSGNRTIAGITALEQTGTPLPHEVLDSIRRNKVALKGPVTTPVGEGFTSVNVGLRKALDLYANLRPVWNLPGVPARFSGVDLVIVRENTEDLYSGLEHEVVPGVVESLKIITERASTRIARFAFEHARAHGRKKVTAIHKANIMKLGDGLFLERARAVAARVSGHRRTTRRSSMPPACTW